MIYELGDALAAWPTLLEMAAAPNPDSGPPDDEVFDLEELLNPNVPRRVMKLPRLVLGALRLVHRAAPGELIFTSVLQIVTSLALAAQVLIGRGC